MKAYTTIEQSCKLAKILLLESADMYYGYGKDKPEFLPVSDVDVKCLSLPCWSLASLLCVLKYPSITQDVENKWSITDWTGAYPKSEHGFDNPVDACYEMILKLNEKNLL